MELKGKVAIVSGAAEGFGKAFAEVLLLKGCKVCLCDINAPLGQKTTGIFEQRFGKENAIFVTCDVTVAEQFADVFKKTKLEYGKIDIVVNNAGVANEKEWRQTIMVNLIGSMQGTELAVKYMSKENGGHGGVIINIGSATGFEPVFFMPAYAASKHGLIGFTRSWSVSKRNEANGLRFACLCPAFAETNLIRFTEGTTLSNSTAEALLKEIGVVKMSQVVESFMELLADESNNGAVLKLTLDDGAEYMYRDAR
ncbi:hypothetical protein LOTGIDRAFT_132061 [Lottia gigantea]|uniref:15-hydroxyprostaglandin dehydrogenase [NAD(+)] n=1 Tax=Lottia gigantea TaxID=225164 RepID=V3Z1Z4_LOTGI|nr:hypothetical protein LOTGIDRAFT_132061 [Lottia gigantea]ESO84578.1 hypothetical protein LOTGIDRAFT_132061 [Lottia gigantea]